MSESDRERLKRLEERIDSLEEFNETLRAFFKKVWDSMWTVREE